MRLWLATKLFFKILFDAALARRVAAVIEAAPEAEATPVEKPKQPAAPARPRAVRSEAVTLLATLQREARFVDFVKEPIDAYDDAQVGAAVRDVHRESAAVLERLFALRPVLTEQEGAQVEVPAGFDSGKYQLTGNVQGDPPFRGPLVHAGWVATRCELPAWSGSDAAARIVAAAEVELA